MNSYTVTIGAGELKAETPEEAAGILLDLLEDGPGNFSVEVLDESTGEQFQIWGSEL